MKKEENFLEDFKRALVSTVKSISQKNDCEIKFGNSDKVTEKNINLPDIKSLGNLDHIIHVRATADSEALRLKHSNKEIYDLYKPKGDTAENLYKIAEKVRYEKIGSQEFKGVEKNISIAFNNPNIDLHKNEKTNDNRKKVLIERKFDFYLRSLFFKMEAKKISSNLKKIRKDWDKNFRKDIDFLKKNLKNQEIFSKIISKIISSIDIQEQKNSENDTSDKERFENIDDHKNRENKDGNADKQKEEQELTISAELPETNDLNEKSSEDEKIEEVEDESGNIKKQHRNMFLERDKKYKIYTTEFDEFSKAEDLESEEE